jgi:hypothetical protein
MNKYGAKLTTVKGKQFHSKREALRYLELDAMQQAGEISDLRLQVKIPLQVVGPDNRAGWIIGHYIADFVYWPYKSDLPCVEPVGDPIQHPVPGATVEDSKGYRTAMYKWKKRHFEAQYNMKIKET